MREMKYRICLSVPLGRRSGTIVIRETNGQIDGCLDVMKHKNDFSGTLSDDGQIEFTGTLKTLISTVRYTATGTLSGCNILLNLRTASGTYYPISGEELKTDDETL